MKNKLFSYNYLDTFVHRLSGVTKLVCFLLLTSSVMFTYDIRIILCILVFSYVMLKISKITFAQIKTMMIYVMIFLITNFILTYIFNPRYGVEIYGTSHEIVRFFGRYDVTLEQLFYQITKFMKYFSVIPLGIIFICTTNPSEFASSLNKIGISYKVCMVLSLTLRYFPDIQRDYQSISQAQQARGLDMSKKEKLGKRLKNISSILIPLIMTTMDRINLISNAMDLRSFGKYKKRTWYTYRPLRRTDYLSMIVCALILAFTLYMRFRVYHTMFWNPFV